MWTISFSLRQELLKDTDLKSHFSSMLTVYCFLFFMPSSPALENVHPQGSEYMVALSVAVRVSLVVYYLKEHLNGPLRQTSVSLLVFFFSGLQIAARNARVSFLLTELAESDKVTHRHIHRLISVSGRSLIQICVFTRVCDHNCPTAGTVGRPLEVSVVRAIFKSHSKKFLSNCKHSSFITMF